jgi:hypothetical protein
MSDSLTTALLGFVLSAALLLSAGCRDEVPPNLVSGDEIQPMERELLAAMKQEEALACSGALMGDEDEKIFEALVLGEGVYGPCHEALSAIEDLRKVNVVQTEDDLGSKLPLHLHGKPLASPDPESALAAVELCAPAIAKARRILAAGPRCSPFRPSRVAMVARHAPLRLSSFLGFEARRAARRGDLDEAFDLLETGIRLSATIGRGTNVMEFSFHAIQARHLIHQIQVLLTQAEGMTKERLRAWDGRLVSMVAAWPHAGDALTLDQLGLMYRIALPTLKPVGWTPVGGWDHGEPPQHERTPYLRDLMALSIVSSRDLVDRFRSRCLRDKPLSHCTKRLTKFPALEEFFPSPEMRALGEAETSMQEVLDAVRAQHQAGQGLTLSQLVNVYTERAWALRGEQPALARAAIQRTLYGQSIRRRFVKYIALAGIDLFLLAAARAQIEVLLQRDTLGRCPTYAEVVGTPPDVRRFVDPYGDSGMKVSPLQDGGILLKPSRHPLREPVFPEGVGPTLVVLRCAERSP